MKKLFILSLLLFIFMLNPLTIKALDIVEDYTLTFNNTIWHWNHTDLDVDIFPNETGQMNIVLYELNHSNKRVSILKEETITFGLASSFNYTFDPLDSFPYELVINGDSIRKGYVMPYFNDYTNTENTFNISVGCFKHDPTNINLNHFQTTNVVPVCVKYDLVEDPHAQFSIFNENLRHFTFSGGLYSMSLEYISDLWDGASEGFFLLSINGSIPPFIDYDIIIDEYAYFDFWHPLSHSLNLTNGYIYHYSLNDNNLQLLSYGESIFILSNERYLLNITPKTNTIKNGSTMYYNVDSTMQTWRTIYSNVSIIDTATNINHVSQYKTLSSSNKIKWVANDLLKQQNVSTTFIFKNYRIWYSGASANTYEFQYTHDYTITQPLPANEKFNDLMSKLYLNTGLGTMVFISAVLILVTFIMAFLKAPAIIIGFVDVSLIIFFTVIGAIPIWLILIITIALAFLIYFKRGSSNEA